MTEPERRIDNLVTDRSHLIDSRPIRWDREAATDLAKAALDDMLEDLEASEPGRVRRRREADRGRLRAILEAITLELWQARRETPTLWLAYSRGDAGYVGSSRYRHPEATMTTVNAVADFLVAAGLAEGKLGSYRKEDHGFGKSGKGYLSRLRGTLGLLEWADGLGLSDVDVALNERFELIRLKGPAERRGGRKPLLTYADTTETNAMRDRLKAWTEMMALHEVTLGIPENDQISEQGHPTDPALEDEEPIERGMNGPCRLYRSFNDGRWDRGGRFYGGWWLGLSGADRRRLLFNGEETIELDFASLHPRLCYQLNGIPLSPDEDPYDIPGVPGDLRGVVKIAVLQLLNAMPGRVGPAMPKGTKVQMRGRMTYKALVAKLERRHSGISNWFRRGLRGLELQAIDASIADGVMDYFTTGLGRPILPVHDSFVVARRDERTLAETMALAYQGQLSARVDDPALPVIRGFSTPEAEADFHAFVQRWS